MTKKTDPIESLSFEQAHKALDEVIEALEENEADLEGSVALFERGKQLLGRCQALLDKAELKVSQLDNDGGILPMDD